jgi:hypothetical protein
MDRYHLGEEFQSVFQMLKVTRKTPDEDCKAAKRLHRGFPRKKMTSRVRIE